MPQEKPTDQLFVCLCRPWHLGTGPRRREPPVPSCAQKQRVRATPGVAGRTVRAPLGSLASDYWPSAAWWESLPSWGGRQLFSSWWNVPLEIVPQGLFSPPTPGRTVINTATNAHDTNWQRECNTSRFSNPSGPIAFPSCLPIRSVLVPQSSNCGVA